MARKQTAEQQEIVREVMREYKRGDLESSSGDKVKKRKQAIAIALHEAGASNQESPATNRENLRRTRARGDGRKPAGDDGPTRDQLYEEARRKGVPGRSRMSKAELSRALGR